MCSIPREGHLSVQPNQTKPNKAEDQTWLLASLSALGKAVPGGQWDFLAVVGASHH